jgi:hypothetical protein
MRKWNIEEEKKPVIDRSRGLAFLRCFVHIIPVAACCVLVAFNTKSYYIGGNLAGPIAPDNEKLFGLQFAAKVLELFALASIGAILLTHLRKELTLGEGLPFGAIFSAQQFHDISILWSLELWGTIFYKWRQKRKKFNFVVLTITCALLALSIGPSSAILMRPRFDYWPSGGTVFWQNATADILFPSTLKDSPELSHCLVDSNALDCPAANWQVITDVLLPFWQKAGVDTIFPQRISIPGPGAIRYMDSSPSQTLYKNVFSLATLGFVSISNTLPQLARQWVFAATTKYGIKRRASYRSDNLFQINTYQPAVSVMCASYQSKDVPGSASGYFAFPNTSDIVFPPGRISTFQGVPLARLPGKVVLDFPAASNITAAIIASLADNAVPSLYWIDTTKENLAKTNSTLYAVAIVPNAKYDAFYSCCSIDTRLAIGAYESHRPDPTTLTAGIENWVGAGTKGPYPIIYPDVTWTKYLNPPISDTNSTVFNTMLQAAGVWNSSVYSSLRLSATEHIVSLMMANGISNINSHVDLLSRLSSDHEQQLLSKSSMDFGGNAFNLTAAEKSGATMLQYKTFNQGYAYSPSGAPQKVAMAVLAVYVLLTLGHIIYSVLTGWSSGNWGRASELTALAMKSEQTNRLNNTGAGITSVTSYTEQTRIEIKDGILQIAFLDAEEGAKVKENKTYG